MSQENRELGMGVTVGNWVMAEPDRMVDWQPIESAPKDGTRILLWDTDEVVIAKWDDISMGGAKGWQIAVVNMIGNVNYYEATFNPTHWMPLPEPPRGYD